MQTNLFKGQAAVMIMSAPDQSIFKRPMSHGARDTLSGLLDWASKYTSLFGHSPRNLMESFCKQYSQLRFEEAEQMYNTDQYVKIINGVKGKGKAPNPKTQADILAAMTLDKLFDRQWAHDHSIPTKNRNGDISQAAEIYNWLISNFLYNDFPSIDLGKIAEMGRTCKPEIVRREALQIKDIDKHTIPYLYAVVRGVTSRDEIIKYRESVENDANIKKLARLGQLALNVDRKVEHKFDANQREQWEVDREFIDLKRSYEE